MNCFQTKQFNRSYDLSITHIEAILVYAQAGLIPWKRNCLFCAQRMELTYEPNDSNKHIWRCNVCMKTARVTQSSPLSGAVLRHFDAQLHLWIDNTAPNTVDKLLGRKNHGSWCRVFRKASHHYMTTQIFPHLILPGPVEIDETRVGQKRFSYTNRFPQVRWVFGLLCRRTRLFIGQFIKDKSH